MAIKWSAFPNGSAISNTDTTVGLQGGANVKWAMSALRTFLLGTATSILAIATGKTLTVSNSLTFTGTDATSFAFPNASDTVVTLAASQVLANKTLTTPNIGAATGTSTVLTGIVTARSATATPAAASAVAGVTMGSAAVGIYWGTGSPNTVVTAAQGSLYIRTDGSGVGDRMYINTDGATAWVAFTTAG